MAAYPTYFEFLDLVVAGGFTAQDILNYRLPEKAQRRIEDLMAKSKEDGLTEDETLEIKEFLDLEHIMRLLKARAARLVG
jgi:protein involved in polysaccharide export with SLBB domain